MIRSSVLHYKYWRLVLTLTSRRKTNISTSQLTTTLIESHNTHFESLSTTIT